MARPRRAWAADRCFGSPRLLFTGDYDSAEVGHQHYDISLDDERFLMVKHGDSYNFV